MLITNNEWVEQYCTSGNYIADLISDKNYILITESEADEEAGNQLKPYVYATDEETGANTYAINGVVANVQYNHSNWSWFGIGVVITTNDSEKTYEYADYVTGDNVRTVAEVASAALEYEADKRNDTQKANVMEYVYSALYQAQGVSKADYEAKAKEEKAESLGSFTLTPNATEYYATVGKEGVETSVTATNGEVSFPVRAKWTSSDEEVAVVDDQGILKATGRGYAVLTPTSSIGLTASATSATAYTGETTLITQNMKNAPTWSRAGQVDSFNVVNGTLDGEGYNRWAATSQNATQYYSIAPSDISSKYFAYMKEQGYAWVRSRMYFENANETVTFRIAVNADTNGGAEKFNELTVPANQWISVDMSLDLYLAVYWNNGEGVDNGYTPEDSKFAMYTTVDEYGMLSIAGANWRAPFVVRSYPTKSYFGDVTLMKETETTVTVTENNVEAKFAEAYDLSKQYPVAESSPAYYTVEGVAYRNEFTPVFKSHNVSIDTNVVKVEATLPVADGSEIHMTKSEAKTATLNVKNGLEVSSVNLVDTEGTYDIDALTGKKTLENAGLTAEYSIVKRYSDGTPMATLDAATAESGIYYYNVTAKKDGVAICNYDTTVDIYKASEGCEYESFKHADSKYAVSAYLGNSIGNYWLTETGKTIAVGEVSSNLHSRRSFDWVDNYDETNIDTTAATGNIYALNLGQTGDGEKVNITNYSGLSNIGYLEFDWSTYKAYEYILRYGGALDVDGDGTNETAIGGNLEYIFTYVLPRHTKEYYQAKATEYSDLAFAYKGTGARYQTSYVQKIEAQKVVLNFNRTWGGDNYEASCDINIAMLVDNYEAFAAGKIPMQAVYNPHENFGSTSINVRLYELFFVANA